MWCGYFDKLRCNINHIQLEVFALTDTFHQIATAYNQTLTSLQPVYIIIIGELTEARVAIGMTQVASHFAPADAGQCIWYYDVSTFVHATKVQLFSEKTRQFVRERTKILSILNVFKLNSVFWEHQQLLLKKLSRLLLFAIGTRNSSYCYRLTIEKNERLKYWSNTLTSHN